MACMRDGCKMRLMIHSCHAALCLPYIEKVHPLSLKFVFHSFVPFMPGSILRSGLYFVLAARQKNILAVHGSGACACVWVGVGVGALLHQGTLWKVLQEWSGVEWLVKHFCVWQHCIVLQEHFGVLVLRFFMEATAMDVHGAHIEFIVLLGYGPPPPPCTVTQLSASVVNTCHIKSQQDEGSVICRFTHNEPLASMPSGRARWRLSSSLQHAPKFGTSQYLAQHISQIGRGGMWITPWLQSAAALLVYTPAHAGALSSYKPSLQRQ
jgi:hypothetical protein